MRAVVQRVAEAGVTVDDEIVGEIGAGLLVYVGVEHADTQADAHTLARKIANLRIFPDDEKKMNRSVLDVGGQVLAISAFTCQADARKGNRPSFDAAAPPEQAEPLYEEFMTKLREAGLTVHAGTFGAYMHVRSINDGPVVILLDSKKTF